MKVELKKVKITLHSHYDSDKTASVFALYNGYDYYISKRQYNSAACRAGLIDGDYFEIYIDIVDDYLGIVSIDKVYPCVTD